MSGRGWCRSQALEWLESSQRWGIKLGLENTRRLLEAMGNPQAKLKFLHVAGTNGKGSVCAMLDSILREAGWRTGLYTSPHLLDFSERIRVAGKKIPDLAVVEGVARLKEAVEGWDHAPTYFELATVLAAWHFAQCGCDWVVWETGMGGRLDSTNAIIPEVAILTPVGLDHQKWLGATVETIAAEKAGILKRGRPAVSAQQCPAVENVFRSRAAELGVPLEFVRGRWEGPLGLAGEHQRENAALAARALEMAGVKVAGEVLERGLAGVVWPGRFQVISRGWVLDGAHNPQAVARLVATWESSFPGEKAELLFSCLADKDASSMAKMLEPISEHCHLVAVGGSRSADLSELAQVWRIPVTVHPGTKEALQRLMPSGKRVLVTGSLYLVGEALEALGLNP